MASTVSGRIKVPSRLGEGIGKGVFPQSTRGLGEHREFLQRGPETHFGVFRRPQNAPFCTYMLIYWGLGQDLGGNCPMPQRRTAPARCLTAGPKLVKILEI